MYFPLANGGRIRYKVCTPIHKVFSHRSASRRIRRLLNVPLGELGEKAKPREIVLLDSFLL